MIFIESDGTVYANHSALVKATHSARIVNGTFRDIDGKVRAAPIDGVPPVTASMPHLDSAERQLMFGTPSGDSGNTGAFRREYSAPGYGWIRATVNVPCGSAVMAGRDTPYVYLGGWGNNGGAIDAGFQYSPTHDWMTAFIKAGETGFNYSTLNYACGRDQTLQLVTTNDPTIVELNAIGPGATVGNTDNDNMVDFVLEVRVNATDGWTQSCLGCVVKRMTSIAQPTENLSDGSSFGMVGGSPAIHWSNTFIGTGIPSMPCYEEGSLLSPSKLCYGRLTVASPTNIRGFQSYPDSSSNIFAYGTGYVEEYDGIQL